MSTAASSTSAAPPSTARSPGKLIFFVLFLAATAFVTYMKNRDAFDGKSPMALHYAPAKWFLAAHAAFGIIAIVLGVFQFSNRLRARYLAQHRLLGYVYVVCVMISAPLAVPVVVKIGTPSLVAATVVQSFGWMVTTAIGLYCIRNGNLEQHRRWMFRSYPYAMVFTVTRLIIPIPPIMAMGNAGIEVVVWSTVAAAAILPSILVEWRDLRQARGGGKAARA